MKKIGRREALKRSLAVVGAVTVAPMVAACGGEEAQSGGDSFTCDDVSGLDDTQRATRTSLQYSDTTADEAKRCDACQLYTAAASGCGTCSVVAGPIHPAGTCASFAPRA